MVRSKYRRLLPTITRSSHSQAKLPPSAQKVKPSDLKEVEQLQTPSITTTSTTTPPTQVKETSPSCPDQTNPSTKRSSQSG